MKITDEMVSAGVEASAFEVHPDVVRRILKEALDTNEPAGVGVETAPRFLPTEDGEFNGNEWDGELSAEEKALIDAAWEKHKSAGPVAKVINDNQHGRTAIIEILRAPPTLDVGTLLFTVPAALKGDEQ